MPEQEQSFFKRKPNFDLEQFISKDGKSYVIRFTTTWILPIQYVLAIFKNKSNAVKETPSSGDAA